jgi:GTP-binding protein
LGIGDLLDMVYDHFIITETDKIEQDMIKVAVIGKPNSGKSSLINKLCREERVIVSDIPGTTRDAIDTVVSRGDDSYVFIDTAGIRKRVKIKENIERYSTMRSWLAIERADICIIMVDAEDGITEQDTKIAGYAHEEGKACIIAINKWDKIEKETGTLEHYEKEVKEALKFMAYAQIVFISAKTGQRVENLFELIKYVFDQASMRLGTGTLNDALNEAIAINQPPTDRGKRLKIYYITQIGVKPPKFVLFVNKKALLHFSYERYIDNFFRKCFGFNGTSIKFIIREKSEKSEKK